MNASHYNLDISSYLYQTHTMVLISLTQIDWLDRYKKDESIDVSYVIVGLTQKAGGLLLYVEGGPGHSVLTGAGKKIRQQNWCG